MCETGMKDEGRRPGMRDEGPGRGTTVRDEGTKYPVIKCKLVQQVEGNVDPLCGYMEGLVTLDKTCD